MKTAMSTLLISLTTWVAATSAQAGDYQSNEYAQAYADFMVVSENEGGSAKNVVEQWEALVSENPTDPFALVMLGSSQTLRGRDAWMPWTKMKHTEAGLDNMARAVRLLQPEHLDKNFQDMPIAFHVKTMAAITFSQVPEFFGRHEDGYYLFEDVLSDPEFLAMPAAAQSFAFYYGIHAARNIDRTQQADAWIDQLAGLPTDDAFVQAARNRESD